MKKIITLLFALLTVFSLAANAANGDIAGNIYYTDIQTYIYHSPITSYNIGGRTVIDAEILNWHYGFDVYWYEDTRRLEITDKGGSFNSLQAMSGEIVESTVSTPGAVYGNYYETDIVTTLNGTPIESYNIGGRTFIVAEAMRDFGYNVDWNEELRTLTVTKPMDFYKIETDYGLIRTQHNYDLGREYKEYGTDVTEILKERAGGILLRDSDNNLHIVETNSNIMIYGPQMFDYYMKLSDIEKLLGAECTLMETTEASHSEWVNGVSYETLNYKYCIEISYDENVNVEVSEFEEEFPLTDIKVNSVYSLPVDLKVNGEESRFSDPHPKGGEYNREIRIIDGEIYVPCHTLAKLLGYDSAGY